jgi:hypothetical protein
MTLSVIVNTTNVTVSVLKMGEDELQETINKHCVFTYPLEEATDEEFLLAALNSRAFDFWRTDDDDDLFDPSDETPL